MQVVMPGDVPRLDPRLAGLELAAAVVAGDARNQDAAGPPAESAVLRRAPPRPPATAPQEARPESSQAQCERQETGNHDPRLLRIERSQGADVFAQRAVGLLGRPRNRPSSGAEDERAFDPRQCRPHGGNRRQRRHRTDGRAPASRIESGRYTSAPSNLRVDGRTSSRPASLFAPWHPPWLSHRRPGSPPRTPHRFLRKTVAMPTAHGRARSTRLAWPAAVAGIVAFSTFSAPLYKLSGAPPAVGPALALPTRRCSSHCWPGGQAPSAPAPVSSRPPGPACSSASRS